MQAHDHIGLLKRFLADDRGDDLVEYALLSALILVGGLAAFNMLQDHMGTVYAGWDTAAQDAWEPCPPAPAACE